MEKGERSSRPGERSRRGIRGREGTDAKGTHHPDQIRCVAIDVQSRRDERSLLCLAFDQFEELAQPPLVGIFVAVARRDAHDELDLLVAELGGADQIDDGALGEHPRRHVTAIAASGGVGVDTCFPGLIVPGAGRVGRLRGRIVPQATEDDAVDDGPVGRRVLQHENLVRGQIDAKVHVADHRHRTAVAQDHVARAGISAETKASTWILELRRQSKGNVEHLLVVVVVVVEVSIR